jgi:hypothetical protein
MLFIKLKNLIICYCQFFLISSHVNHVILNFIASWKNHEWLSNMSVLVIVIAEKTLNNAHPWDPKIVAVWNGGRCSEVNHAKKN